MAHKSENKTMLERFEEKFIPVTETGCWVWTAAAHGRGYGLFHTGRPLRKGKMEFAHRVSYELYKGYVPQEFDEVCHKCDNPSCVNPEHLFIGSHEDNMKDMISKNRFVSGREVVNEDMFILAQQMRKDGITVREIAKVLGVSESQASRISRGNRKHFNSEG